MICSWRNDIQYLEYCLRSIAKFATGFQNIVLVVAEEEEKLFRQYQSDCVLKAYKRVSEPIKWHLDSQAQKCLADVHCTADFVCFVDSDCCFIEPVTPSDYFASGKPILLIESFDRLPDNPWKWPTDKALGIDAKWESMRRHGAVHYRGLFVEFRRHIQNNHGVLFRDYVLSCKPEFPWGFSEFVALGNFAIISPWKDKYHFIDLGMQVRPKDKLLQFWSHAPIDKLQDLPSGGKGTPMEEFRRLGL